MKKTTLPSTSSPIEIPAPSSFWRSVLPSRQTAFIKILFTIAAILADVAAIKIAELLYRGVFAASLYDTKYTLIITSIVAVLNLAYSEYDITNYLKWARYTKKASIALFTLAVVLAIVKASSPENTSTNIIPLVIASLMTLIGTRILISNAAHQIIAIGKTATRRLFLIGYEKDVDIFRRIEKNKNDSSKVIGSIFIREPSTTETHKEKNIRTAEDIALTLSVLRFVKPDDILLMLPWHDTNTLKRYIDELQNIPATLHLWPETILKRFSAVEVEQIGPHRMLKVMRRKPSKIDHNIKRTFDVVMSGLGLLFLMPLFLLIGLFIKLDSQGPVFFMQKRYGFNQEPFTVFKFRTMANAPGQAFQQASRNDKRITAVGRFLRRWNLDELPQLLNVLKGDMSLVGPRPHAIAHDHLFMQKITSYARRHNVKPGITGWAQVNGLRGETLTDEDMKRRIECDLYYIDHWSIWMDIKIIILTIISPKSYRNAY